MEKDSNRTLAITTYQFVKVTKLNSEEQLSSRLGSVGISKTRVSGNGLSLVKIHFYEPTTAFRHMNEVLYIMSLDEYKQYFLTDEGKLVSRILLTVDGGGDERPRNKITQFCAVVLRIILDLDKYKVHSLAEHSSKYHSVERLHTAENRALSYEGPISSKQVHEKEVDSRGIYSEQKFKENMQFAQNEAVKCLQGVPYSNDTINGVKSPDCSKFVFDTSYEVKFKKFLLRDSTEYRQNCNFLIKPAGEIWEKLCEMYNLTKNLAKSAYHIHNLMTNPDFSTICHYSFTAIRINEEWRWAPVSKYEVQPILDISRLPEHHYLPFEEAVRVINELSSETGVPEFVSVPDFFLPSRNIKFLMEHKPEELENNVDGVSNLIGVSGEKIQAYIQELE